MALRRVLLGSQDVNNFLPVAKEPPSNTEPPPVPSPVVTVQSVKEGFLFPDLALVQSDAETSLHQAASWTRRPPQHLGVVSISTGGGGGLPSEPFKGNAQLRCSCAEGACLTGWLTQAEALMYQRKMVNVR